jgi:hypothetical protein
LTFAGRLYPAGSFVVGFFLFFVDWDVCEKQAACLLRASETVRLTFTDGSPPITSVVPPTLIPLGDAWLKAPRNPPLPRCETVVIWMDGPGSVATTNIAPEAAKGFSETVDQKLELLDAITQSVVDTVRVKIQVGVDQGGKLSASP